MKFVEKEITFANKPLTLKKIIKFKEFLTDNKNLKKVEITTTRNFWENNSIASERITFESFDEFINYLNTNEIRKLKEIDIKVYFNDNRANLRYKNFGQAYWVLTYNKQDADMNSMIYNLNGIFKSNIIIRMYKKNRDEIILYSSIAYMFLFCFTKNKPLIGIFTVLLIVGWLNRVLFRNYAYKENKFINKNKDAIILSVIFYILGVITPFLIKVIQSGILSQKK